MLKALKKFLVLYSLVVLGVTGVAYASTLQGFQGGTGISTSTSGNDGLCLTQSSSTPFLRWTIGACGGGSGSISTSTIITPNSFTYWTGSSTIGSTSTPVLSVTASGTIIQIGSLSATGAMTLGVSQFLGNYTNNLNWITSSTGWTDGKILFGTANNYATSSALFGVNTSTGQFTVGSSSYTNASGTNETLSGYIASNNAFFTGVNSSSQARNNSSTVGASFTLTGKVGSLYADVNGLVAATSTIIPNTATSPITLSAGGVIACATCATFSNGVNGGVMFFNGASSATSSLLFSVSTSTGVFTIGTSSIANTSGTNASFTGFVSAANGFLTAVSSTNGTFSGYLVVSGALKDPAGNKYVTSTAAGNTGLQSSTASGFVPGVGQIPFFFGNANTLAGSSTLTFTTSTVFNYLNFTGVVSSSEIRSPSSTINALFDASGNKYVTSTAAASGVTNYFETHLSPSNAVFPNSGFAQTTRYNQGSANSVNMPAIQFNPGTSSIAQWWTQINTTTTAMTACTFTFGAVTTSTTAFASSTGFDVFAQTMNASSSMDSLMTNFYVGHVTSTFATSSPAVASTTPPLYFSVTTGTAQFAPGVATLIMLQHVNTDPFGGSLQIPDINLTCK